MQVYSLTCRGRMGLQFRLIAPTAGLTQVLAAVTTT